MKIDFAQPPSVLIRGRRSCRTFSRKPMEENAGRVLARDAASLRQGLLGERASFSLVEIPEKAGVQFSNYGLISGARFFILGAISRSERFRESYAFLLEHLVLKACELGMDTCWVGFFRPADFKNFDPLAGDERPAVVVVGYRAARERLRDRLIITSIRASNRRPWRDLFFKGALDTPLSEFEAGAYALPLEMVRLAPSSGNTQPWRVVKEPGSPTFHFYMKKVRKAYFARGLHELDIGIAMAHFDLTCREANTPGTWVLSPPTPRHIASDIEYRWTWKGSA